jgi:putative membrane protein
MKMTRMQVFAGVFCFALPLAIAAQTTAADPTMPTPGSQSASPMGMPSSTSGQMTPGMTRQNPNGSGGMMGEAAAPMGMMADTSMMDKHFLKAASEGGMAEIQLGQLASSKGDSAQVKAYGQRMVTDHTMLNNELKPFADKEGIAPPTVLNAADLAEFDKLNGLTGADFDKEYVAFMMKDHKKDLMDFRHEASMTSNQQLKMAVSKGEKVISEHKQMIDKIGATMSISAKM